MLRSQYSANKDCSQKPKVWLAILTKELDLPVKLKNHYSEKIRQRFFRGDAGGGGGRFLGICTSMFGVSEPLRGLIGGATLAAVVGIEGRGRLTMLLYEVRLPAEIVFERTFGGRGGAGMGVSTV